MDHLTVERGLAENSRRAYREDLSEFLAYLRRCQIEQLQAVQRLHVTGFLLEQRRPGATARGNPRPALSVRSVVRRLAALRMFFRFLVREKLLLTDVTQNIDTPKLWQNLPHTLTYQEMDNLLAAPQPDTVLGLRDKAMIEFMYATGLRVSEVAHLTLNNLNLEAGFLRTTGKGNKERIVPVGSVAADWMRRYLAESRPRLGRQPGAQSEVFLSMRGAGLSTKTIWVIIKKHARAAGIAKSISPHTLRHSFARHLVDNGGDLRVIQEMLGHADIATTQIYVQMDEGRLKEAHYRFHPRSGRRP